MSEYKPLDDDSRFADIMSGFGDFGRERGDPLIDDIFSEILNAETTINSQPSALGPDELQEVTELLNSLFTNRGLGGAEMTIAGKIRPAATMLDREGRLRADVPAVIKTLGEPQYDHAGAYFAVSDEQLRYATLTLEPATGLDPLGEEYIRYTAALHFAIGASAVPQLYAYPEDIDTCAPVVASDEKIEHVLRVEYPEVLAQIDAQLPADCRDDQKIVRALASFRLALDWNQYPNLKALEKSDLYDYISRYITTRIQFDTSMYGLKVRESYLSVNASGDIVTVQLPEPIVMYVGIDLVQLMEAEPQAGAPTYGALITARAPSSERGGGSYVVHIPAANIPAMKALRNTGLSLTDPAFDVLPEISPKVLEPLPEAKLPAIDYAARIEAREHELLRLEKWWQDLLVSAQEVMDKTYASERKARKAAERLEAIVRAAGRDYPSNFSTVIEAYGEGVVGVSPVLDEEASGYDTDDETVTVVFKNAGPKASTIATPRRGIYTRTGSTFLRESDDEPPIHSVEGRLLFSDIDVENATLSTLPMPGTEPLHVLHRQQHFTIKLDTAASHITIPELEHLRDCRQAIETVKDKYPNLPDLPQQLAELQYQVGSADQSSYTDISDVTILRSMGASVAGDKKACADVMSALTSILKGAPVEVSGPIYRLNGELEDTHVIRGIIEGAVSIVGETDTEEPLLVVGSSTTERWYVPLSAIERCRF